MPARGPAPLVTGISPREGPPGTRIIIRGDNLGIDPKDLIGLRICGCDCLLSAEWHTSSKIVARTGPGKGKGDVIVATMSGGDGSCTVGFRGTFLQIGPLQEYAVWTDESQTVLVNFSHGRPSSPMLSKDDDDPLSLSDEGNQTKFSEEILLELFPEASGNLSLENFSSAWYLLENHHETSFSDLKLGLAHLKRKATQRQDGPIDFVRSNLSSTLDCLESLAEMYQKFTTDDIRGDCMNSYAVLLMQAKSCADGLFQEVLGRKDKADATRNALNVLQRFKFLFYLPLNIERNIQKGDYSLVINDYVRARSLFQDTQVQVFKKVYQEVEKQILAFQNMLHQKLLDLPNTLDEQKKIIGYLINLECKGDPAWECLENQQKWLTSILTQCKDGHIEQEMASLQTDAEGKTKVIETPVKADTKTGKNRDPSFTSSGSPDQTGWKFRTPQKVLFAEELTDLMMDNIPDFWKLGNSYFSGSLLMKESGEKAFKIDTTKHSQFKQMIMDVISLFVNLLRAAFLPATLDNLPQLNMGLYGKWPAAKQDISGAWLPQCVRYVRASVSSISALDLPGDAKDFIQELAIDMRTHCMFSLLKQAITDVQSLHTKETWILEVDDVYGGTTQLPALFENIVNETVQHLHEVVVQNKTGEPEIFSQRPVQKEATSLFSQLLEAFAPCLECLVLPQQPSVESHKDEVLPSTPDTEHMDDSVPSLDKRLMITLSNCNHTMEHIIPSLVENLNKHGYVEMNKALQSAQERYRELDGKFFESYIEEKSNPIVGAMEQNMYRGKFDWKTCKKPIGVRNYLKEVIMGMIEVHAEVFSISPAFVHRVMSMIVEAMSEEISRLIQCATAFSTHGMLQARLELNAIQDAVALYMTTHATRCFEEAQNSLPGFSGAEKKELEELLNIFKSQMKFQLMCFRNNSTPKKSIS